MCIFAKRTVKYKSMKRVIVISTSLHLFCGDVNDANDIKGNPKLNEAYLLGKGV